MSNVPLQDEWWAHLDGFLTRDEAIPLAEAALCLIELRVMGLDAKMQRLLYEMRAAEQRRTDIADLVEEYSEALSRSQKLKTKAGRMEFLDDVMTTYYKDKRMEEEVLPL